MPTCLFAALQVIFLMTFPVSATDLIAATGGIAAGFDPGCVRVSGISTDSRTLRPGELFWALRGERHDGHNFIDAAWARGAAACVVETTAPEPHRGPSIEVDNTLHALWDLARWSRGQQDALMIGVTGSSGKTTTRTLIHTVLESNFTGIQSPRNFNNHIGLPLSILGIRHNHEFAVLELGASASGEIRELAGIAEPEIGVVTSIGLSHVSSFGSIEHITEAKGELIEALPAEGLAVLAGDDPRVRSLADRAACRVVFIGEGADNDLRATDVEISRNQVTFRVDGQLYVLAATGRHHVGAALCAIAVAREVGIDELNVAAALNSFVPVQGRCRLEEIGPWTVIDDTYNANPASMQAACRVLADWDGFGKRILVAGDMLELGELTEHCHRQLGRWAAEAQTDRLLVYGEHAKHVVHAALEAGLSAHNLAECEDWDALLAVLDCCLEEGDVVLVKGSRALRMERVVEWLRSQHENNRQPRGLVAAA